MKAMFKKQTEKDRKDESEGTAAYHHAKAHEHMRKAVSMAKKETAHKHKRHHPKKKEK